MEATSVQNYARGTARKYHTCEEPLAVTRAVINQKRALSLNPVDPGMEHTRNTVTGPAGM